MVWRPDGYAGTDCVLYVHGYYTDAPSAMKNYKLAEQFEASGVKAWFIVPEAPSGSSDSVKFPDLQALLNQVGQKLGVFLAPPYTAIGHSGAYRTIIPWLNNAGLKKITLLDALYSGADQFAKWAAKGNQLINVAATEPVITNSKNIEGRPGVTSIRVRAEHMSLVTSGKYIPRFVEVMKKTTSGILVILAVIAGALFLLRRF